MAKLLSPGSPVMRTKGQWHECCVYTSTYAVRASSSYNKAALSTNVLLFSLFLFCFLLLSFIFFLSQMCTQKTFYTLHAKKGKEKKRKEKKKTFQLYLCSSLKMLVYYKFVERAKQTCLLTDYPAKIN